MQTGFNPEQSSAASHILTFMMHNGAGQCPVARRLQRVAFVAVYGAARCMAFVAGLDVTILVSKNAGAAARCDGPVLREVLLCCNVLQQQRHRADPPTVGEVRGDVGHSPRPDRTAQGRPMRVGLCQMSFVGSLVCQLSLRVPGSCTSGPRLSPTRTLSPSRTRSPSRSPYGPTSPLPLRPIPSFQH